MHAVDSVRTDDTCCVLDEIAEEKLVMAHRLLLYHYESNSVKMVWSQQVSL